MEIPHAPVFRPTIDEFQDALSYLNKIRPEAEKYGRWRQCVFFFLRFVLRYVVIWLTLVSRCFCLVVGLFV